MTTPRHEPAHEALDAVMAEIRHGLDALVQLLDAECEALNNGDITAIDHIGTRKQALVQQLEQFDVQRRQLAQVLPPPANAQSPAWQDVIRALQQCQSLNQRNGNIASRRLQLVRQALAVLTGGSADGLYDNSGGLHTGPGRSRPLAAA